MRRVKMYNAFFGDCFVIHEGANNGTYRELVVDCGVHHKTVPFSYWGTRIDSNQRIKDITDDLAACHQDADLLITHFHYDHISGLSYLHSLGTAPMRFNDVYLPNIWNFPFIVATVLLEDLIVQRTLAGNRVPSIIPRRSVGLLPFLNSLCRSSRNIHFLKRGDTFRNNEFITLLPDDNVLRNVAEEYETLPIPTPLRNGLNNLATAICNVVIQNAENGQMLVTDDRLLGQIQSLNGRYEELEGVFAQREDDIGNWFDSDVETKLNKLGNEISIVFQNNDVGENMLFTGDAESSDLNRIMTLTDILMHDHYKYIKLPHHGTESHYVDFSAYDPEWVLIPNGRASAMGRGYPQIYSGYSTLGDNKICSNSNFCTCCSIGRCTTVTCGSCGTTCHRPCVSNRHIVFPGLFKAV